MEWSNSLLLHQLIYRTLRYSIELLPCILDLLDSQIVGGRISAHERANLCGFKYPKRSSLYDDPVHPFT